MYNVSRPNAHTNARSDAIELLCKLACRFEFVVQSSK